MTLATNVVLLNEDSYPALIALCHSAVLSPTGLRERLGTQEEMTNPYTMHTLHN